MLSCAIALRIPNKMILHFVAAPCGKATCKAAAIQMIGGVWGSMVYLAQPPDDFFTLRHIVVYIPVLLWA